LGEIQEKANAPRGERGEEKGAGGEEEALKKSKRSRNEMTQVPLPSRGRERRVRKRKLGKKNSAHLRAMKKPNQRRNLRKERKERKSLSRP